MIPVGCRIVSGCLVLCPVDASVQPLLRFYCVMVRHPVIVSMDVNVLYLYCSIIISHPVILYFIL